MIEAERIELEARLVFDRIVAVRQIGPQCPWFRSKALDRAGCFTRIWADLDEFRSGPSPSQRAPPHRPCASGCPLPA